jgi:glycosyltransferase involved in cell wall biosynthesis
MPGSRIANLRLAGQVRFLGYVPEGDLRALYRLVTWLVQPSLSEARSVPMFGAWLDGLPVACSRATALPEQVQDAALMFVRSARRRRHRGGDWGAGHW